VKPSALIVNPNLSTAPGHHLRSASGLQARLFADGGVQRLDCHGVMLNLFVGNALEGGPTNLWLRRVDGAAVTAVPLLGPLSPLRGPATAPGAEAYTAQGHWQGIDVQLQLRLAATAAAWFWHLSLHNTGVATQVLDLVLVHDIGLAPYATTRLNEYYVSHYVDLAPLTHPKRGVLVAARQNQPVAGRHPWAMVGSLRRGARGATDALQVLGLDVRCGGLPRGIVQGLPGSRLQHEHALMAIQDEAITLAAGGHIAAGFFGRVLDDHPQATGADDLALADATLELPEAQALAWPALPATTPAGPAPGPSLFARAPWLTTLELDGPQLDALFGSTRRHAEVDAGTLLSFFHGDEAHVVLRAKEQRVQRPHGHILCSGQHLVPDETALTSTVWMAGVFHSMVTQGHVSINRFLTTVRGMLGQFRAQGQRIFVHVDGAWCQLGVPSAFEIEPMACRWLYRHADGLLQVRAAASDAPHELTLEVSGLQGPSIRLMVTHQVALSGDEGSVGAPLHPIALQPLEGGVWVGVPAGSELAGRFPQGGFVILPLAGTVFEQAGGDECLHADGQGRGQPWVCITGRAAPQFGLRIAGRLLQATAAPAGRASLPRWTAAGPGAPAAVAHQLAEIAPWYLHNALVHYLSPRGLEQFSGGGWGTRDVCQGPLEMLLALDQPAPVRDLLLRVFAAQDVGGDWPQWFMFFERDRHIRAGDSHGDIVFWPLLGLARYLLASGDLALLDEPVPFFAADAAQAEVASVWQHVQRALAVIQQRRIPGTHLATYGHGDWNDSLQPAEPALRDRLCSAWTVTLHHQMLRALAAALQGSQRGDEATALGSEADAVLADFQRLLVAGGVVTGYALFPPEAGGAPPERYLLHPQDALTGVRYSLLPMMHAILDDMLSPEQAAAHVQLIEQHLLGPDGARLFDRPLPYRGGPMTLFQRAESSAFFGREIGVMYMHAHLRWAETLAHLGLAEKFFAALALAHPIALRERVPSASLRQANCYFSSSDAAFADRYDAQEHYARVASGEVPLDGGWRIYSSGPGIAIGLIVGCFLGVRRRARTLVLDPVLPASLRGLQACVELEGHEVQIDYRPGAQGCGPVWLELDGTPLHFTRGPNPYRCGAAEIDREALRQRLAVPPADGAMHRLVVHLG
jgi:cellobiose phosphorylase